MPEIEQLAAPAPGTSVPVGSLFSPGGPIGGGANAWTLTTAQFTIPAIGATVVASVQDSSWAVIGEFVWVATAGGSANVPMALQVTAKTATTITLLNPVVSGTAPSSDPNNLITLGSDNLLYLPASRVISTVQPSADAGNLLIDGSDSQPYVGAAQIQPTIWSQTRRMWNAVGNPSFEVDQRNVGNAVTAAAGTNNAFCVDRWSYGKVAATGACTFQQTAFNTLVPGTNFQISRRMLRVTVTTAQATLAAGEYLQLMQNIEGPNWRELINDVHSVSVLVQSSVAGLKFSVCLSDNPVSQSIVYLCTIPNANTPTLLTLPAIPIWPAGNFVWPPGGVGYRILISLGSGTTYTAPAAGAWQAGNYSAASGTSNFLASAANSTFDLMYIQHEPGPLCTTLQDKPFTVNLTECERYYFKSYQYSTAQIGGSGPATYIGANATFRAYSTAGANGYAPFARRMAKVPTVNVFAPSNGNYNNVNDNASGAVVAITGNANVSDQSFLQIQASGNTLTAGNTYVIHYTADTGW